jgi:uncharacterized protein YkwD
MRRNPRFLASLALVGVMTGCGTAAAHHAEAGRGETTTVVPAVADPGPVSHVIADRLSATAPLANALYTPANAATTAPATTAALAEAPAQPAPASPDAAQEGTPAPPKAAASDDTSGTTAEDEDVAPAADHSAEADQAAAPAPAPTPRAVPAPAPAPAPVAAPAPEPSTLAVASAAGFDAGAEAGFLQATNATRASLGVAPLTMDAGLQAYARRQAQAMADAGQIFHSQISNLLGAWSTAGENVGVGPSVGSIHAALVASPGHFRNLSDPGFVAMGVGVVVDGAGRMWTAHVFAA